MALPSLDRAVSLRGVTVRRRGRVVLADVSLEVNPGTIVGVIGPNGAGKSTLIEALCGFLNADEGEVRVLGLDLRRAGAREKRSLRRRIGLLPQLCEVNALMPLTAREVVEIGRAGRAGLGRRLGSADHEAVSGALTRFGLMELAGRPYHSLSGGEQRKTQLARVFAQEPELMLLDEPMASLDLAWIEALRKQIESVWKELGATIIMVTHETHHLPAAAARVALLGGGRVLAEGAPAELLQEDTLARGYGPGVRVMHKDGRVYTLGG
jgi:ABC-type cobalamin/Fe3+-siderophores transport system ATPase subunit